MDGGEVVGLSGNRDAHGRVGGRFQTLCRDVRDPQNAELRDSPWGFPWVVSTWGSFFYQGFSVSQLFALFPFFFGPRPHFLCLSSAVVSFPGRAVSPRWSEFAIFFRVPFAIVPAGVSVGF